MNKTHTLEELTLAQAKGCRIEYQDINGNWLPVSDRLDKVITFACCRIHPADEWKARRPVPPEFLHPDELAEAQTCAIQHNQENAKNLRDPKGFCKVCGTDWPEAAPAPAATPTDTPETDALRESYVHLGPNWLAFEVFAKASERFERRARAAETKLAKWESELSKVMPQDFKDWWQNSREEWPEVASMVIEGLHKQVKLADRAAEARVKELEEERKDISSCRDAACAKLQRHYDTLRKLAVATWRTNYADEAPQWEPLPDIDGIIGQIDNMTAGLAQQVAELKWDNAKILATRRLRPIAEAGPVPERMVRLYAERYLNRQWLFAEDPCSLDTHFIDIYPPQQ